LFSLQAYYCCPKDAAAVVAALAVSRMLTGFVLPARCAAASIFVSTSFRACATVRSAAAEVCCADMAATTAIRLAAMRAMQLLRVCGCVGETAAVVLLLLLLVRMGADACTGLWASSNWESIETNCATGQTLQTQQKQAI
jgi:hypothetical protein